jgi:hypothetical protein
MSGTDTQSSEEEELLSQAKFYPEQEDQFSAVHAKISKLERRILALEHIVRILEDK